MSQGSNWDVYPIRILLEVVESVLRCGTIIQVSFPHKCGQLNWCSALNVEVIVSFSRYFLFSLLAHVFENFHGVLFFCVGGQLRHPRGAFAPRTMGLSISPP